MTHRMIQRIADGLWAVLDDVFCTASYLGYRPPWYLEWYARGGNP